jgi:predicted dehydrogenase
VSASGFVRGLEPDALFARGDVYRVGRDAERAARSTVRLAILGAGGVAQAKYLPSLVRLRTLWEPVELVALSTLEEGQAGKLSRQWSVPVYADAARLLGDHRPDAVIVSSSDAAHRELALAALEAGAHVLVEKPLARTLVEAAEMCSAAEAAGRVLLTVCNKRYSPPYAEARALLERGAVPDPSICSGKLVCGYGYVDLLESATVHIFDLFRFLMGDIGRVRALAPGRAGRERAGSGPRAVIVTCSFASGAIGSITSSATALSLHPWERVEIFGDGAWLAVDDQSTLTLHDEEYGPARSWSPVVPNTLLSGEEWGGYVGLLDEFLQAARGVPPASTAPWDGYRALELVVATHLSLARADAVDLPLEPAGASEELRAAAR